MEKSGNRNKYPHGYLRSRCALNQPESHGSAIRIWYLFDIVIGAEGVTINYPPELEADFDVLVKLQ